MRRQRRGLTLVEAVVTIMLSAIAVLVLTTLVDSVSRTTILQSEARALSRAADDAVRAARSDLDAHIAAAQGSVIRIGAGDITGLTPSLLTDSTPVTATTPYGHTIQFAHFAPDPDTLLVLTWTTETLAGVQGIAIPRVRPGGGIRRVGRAGGITADLRCPGRSLVRCRNQLGHGPFHRGGGDAGSGGRGTGGNTRHFTGARTDATPVAHSQCTTSSVAHGHRDAGEWHDRQCRSGGGTPDHRRNRDPDDHPGDSPGIACGDGGAG